MRFFFFVLELYFKPAVLIYWLHLLAVTGITIKLVKLHDMALQKQLVDALKFVTGFSSVDC